LHLIIDEVNKKQTVIEKSMLIEVQLGTAISFICGAISQANLKVKRSCWKRLLRKLWIKTMAEIINYRCNDDSKKIKLFR